MTWVRSRPGAVSELTVDSKSTPNRTRNGSKNTLKFEPGLELFFFVAHGDDGNEYDENGYDDDVADGHDDDESDDCDDNVATSSSSSSSSLTALQRMPPKRGCARTWIVLSVLRLAPEHDVGRAWEFRA